MLWLMTMGRRLNGVYAAFMLVAFMMGIAGALQAPTLSLFLSREVGAQPFWVGLFYTVNAIAGILVSLALAKRSDSRGDRRRLIMFCCLMAVGNALLFAFNRHYLTLITCGVMLASVANAAMPQLFALAREYADSSAREVVMFSSIMRAQLSLAWVIGPPLAFMLALNYGFTTMFSIAAGIFVISLALIAVKLPSVARVEQPSEGADVLVQAGGWHDKNVRMLFIASTLMWTCNTMYIIDMPLWISSDLGLPDSLAGILMGTAAGLEIPAMILAGYYVKRWGKRKMMVTAVAAFSSGSVSPGLMANCAPASVTSASCFAFVTVPAPIMASGTSLAIARMASIAQAVRRVTSRTRTPPATSAFAIGTACSSLFTTITGTTGPVVRIASALVFQFFIRVFSRQIVKIKSS